MCWLEAAEEDLREMEVKRWQRKAVVGEWASVIKEAKALRGPYSQVVREVRAFWRNLLPSSSGYPECEGI